MILMCMVISYNMLPKSLLLQIEIEKVGVVLPLQIVKSNISSVQVGPAFVREKQFFLAYIWNVCCTARYHALRHVVYGWFIWKFRNRSSKVSLILRRSILRSNLWGTLSKALENSNKTMSVKLSCDFAYPVVKTRQ